VEITIYNVLGQLVKNLVDANKKAGYHSTTWDGTDNSGLRMATGMYMYKIKAGDFVDTRKIIMLK